jgi:hypothetical protein
MGAKTSNQGAARNHFFIFDKWFSSNRPNFCFFACLMRDFTTSSAGNPSSVLLCD